MKTLLFAGIVLSAFSTPANVGIDRAAGDYVRPALKSIGGSVRINYAGVCPGGSRLLFPSVNIQPEPDGASGITAVRQMFGNDPQVTVTQDRSGVLRITVGNVDSSALRTRIPTLTLNSDAQYTPLVATLTISNALLAYSPEHLETALGTIDIIVHRPDETAPHLPPLLQNITVDDALDSVAQTFKGIVLYGACTQSDGKKVFSIDYVYGDL